MGDEKKIYAACVSYPQVLHKSLAGIYINSLKNKKKIEALWLSTVLDF